MRQRLPPAATCHLLRCSTGSSGIATAQTRPGCLQGCQDKSDLPTHEITTENGEEGDRVLPDIGHTLAKHPLERLSCTPETARLQPIPGLQLHTLVARRK